jgi:hypothetical protein
LRQGFGHRYDDMRINYSPPVSAYDLYGQAIYAAFRAPQYTAMPAPQMFAPASVYSDHYQFPQHPSLYQSHVSHFHYFDRTFWHYSTGED